MYQVIKKKLNVSRFFEIKSWMVYLLSIAMGLVKLSSGATPFGLAFIGALSDYGFPLILPLAILCITTGIAFGPICLCKTLMASLFFVILKSFVKGNSKTGTSAKILCATALSEIVVLLFSNTLIYDGIMAAFMSTTTAIFYLIFTEGLPVLLEWGEQKISTYETLMASGIVLAVIATALGNFTILSLSVRNILCIFIVLFLGWRKGMTCGIVAGLSVSLVLGMMGLAGGSIVATYVVCGLLAGVLSRFGKIGAIIGFVMGNAIWVYYSNASTEVLIPIGEIMIASIALFFLPKRVTNWVENLFDFENVLEAKGPVGYLAESTIFKLKSVSEVAEDMANNMEQVTAEETNEMHQFMNQWKEHACEKCSKKADCWGKNYHAIYETAFQALAILQEKGSIEVDDISSNVCANQEVLLDGIRQAYEVYRINTNWKEKIKEDKQLVAKQLRGVSQAIDTVQEEIQSDVLGTDTQSMLGAGFQLHVGMASAKQKGSEVSGDTTRYVQLKNGKLFVGLSDGMGSGTQAEKASQKVLALTEKYMNTGLDKRVVLDMLNAYMMLGENQSQYATLDAFLFNREDGKAQMIKLGACPTYLVQDNKIQKINSQSLPVGAIAQNDAEIFQQQLERNMMIVMLSDGVLEANAQNEKWVEEVLLSIKKENVQRIADIILQEAIDENLGFPKDDMSIIVMKVC